MVCVYFDVEPDDNEMFSVAKMTAIERMLICFF